MEFDYFYGDEAEQFTFYRIPKVLVTSPLFKRISDSAKLLYGLMLDRMGLSIKNGWIDNENRAYIFFTTKDVMEMMCCGTEKATKIFAELDCEKGIGLVERKKQGQGKPAIVYLKKFMLSDSEAQKSRLSVSENQDFGKSKVQTFDNRNSRLSEVENADFRKSKCNYNKNNNTDVSNINQSNQDDECWIDRYNKNISLVKNQVDYDGLIANNNRQLVDNIVSVMAEVMSAELSRTYKIENYPYTAYDIQEQFKKLTYEHIEIFLMEYAKITERIGNPKAYLISALFNLPTTAELTLANRVIHGMYGKE